MVNATTCGIASLGAEEMRIILYVTALLFSLMPLFFQVMETEGGLESLTSLSSYLRPYSSILLMGIIFSAIALTDSIKIFLFANIKKDATTVLLATFFVSVLMTILSLSMLWYPSQSSLHVEEIINPGAHRGVGVIYEVRLPFQKLIMKLIGHSEVVPVELSTLKYRVQTMNWILATTLLSSIFLKGLAWRMERLNGSRAPVSRIG